uniref:Uncharacterized protein n=1 Tax=Setaria italica TaxID=4555 RepID=K4AN25_SETIT
MTRWFTILRTTCLTIGMKSHAFSCHHWPQLTTIA